MTRGLFITVEGIDGAGKSTHAAWLVDTLKARGHRVVATREPGGTPLGEALREILLHQPMAHESEALLMFAARRQHIVDVIAPALDRGDTVVCEISDAGPGLPMPPADQYGRPAVDALGGRGLWLAFHLCDEFTVKSDRAGTVATAAFYASESRRA